MSTPTLISPCRIPHRHTWLTHFLSLPLPSADYACIHSQGEEDPEAVRRSRLWSADPVNKAQVVGMIQERVASGAFPLNNDEFKERFKLLSS